MGARVHAGDTTRAAVFETGASRLDSVSASLTDGRAVCVFAPGTVASKQICHAASPRKSNRIASYGIR